LTPICHNVRCLIQLVARALAGAPATPKNGGKQPFSTSQAQFLNFVDSGLWTVGFVHLIVFQTHNGGHKKTKIPRHK
jgi:hypothetical protein